jgi:periplasmic divalent cation tolerance protein
MPKSSLSARVVLTNVASLEEARRMGHMLVDERLAACATIIPAVNSIYRWEGKVTSAPEIMIMLKTSAEQIPALEARIRALHTYVTPEFLVLPVEAASKGYLEWLQESLRIP